MKKAKLLIAVFLLALILLRPEAAIAGAQRGMRIWFESVAPALFPFLAMMPLLTGPEACAFYNSLLGGFMRRVFRLPGSAAAAVMIGLIAGSPGGAIAIRQVGESASLTKQQVHRLAACVCGVSPAFLILSVGQGLYGSAALGFALAGIQICVQLGMLLFTRGNEGVEVPAEPQKQEKRSVFSMARAVESALVICGYMVFFGSMASAMVSLCGKTMGTVLLLLADLPGGLAELATMRMPGKMLLQGAAIGFGGLCIGMQNLDVLRTFGFRPRTYFAGRGIAGGLFACACGILLRGETVERMPMPVSPYVISLLIAAFGAIPAMIFFSRKYFINIKE